MAMSEEDGAQWWRSVTLQNSHGMRTKQMRQPASDVLRMSYAAWYRRVMIANYARRLHG